MFLFPIQPFISFNSKQQLKVHKPEFRCAVANWIKENQYHIFIKKIILGKSPNPLPN